MRPGDGSRRQPSGSALNFPYGDCLNKRKTRRLKRAGSRRATGSFSWRKPAPDLIRDTGSRGENASNTDAEPLTFYSELVGIIADKILA
jgi:hypothetical protein